MMFRGSLIIQDKHEWRIHVADDFRTLPKATDNAEIVAAVKELRKKSNFVNTGCIIAPASDSCFFSRLNLPSELDTRDRPSLIYELENHLPIDAESMSADFAALPSAVAQDQSPRGASVSAIAIEVHEWKPLTDSLEAANIPVTNIIPSAALAITSLHEKHAFVGTNSLLLCHGDHADLITLADDCIFSWKYFKLEAASLKRHKNLDLAKSKQTLVVDCPEAQVALIRDNAGAIQLDSDSLISHYLQGANTALSKPSSNLFNLRRDDLASEDPLRPISRQLSWLAFAVATCLATMIFGSWWRATRIESRIAKNLLAQSEAFEESFPDTRVPASLLRRVRSEHSRIMGSRNATKQIEAPNSATEVMRVLLASLPTATRMRISSIDIRNGDLNLTFQVQHFVDAGVVAEALSQGGFDVSQPATTQKDAKTFESSLQAKWRKDSSANTNHAGEKPAAIPRVEQGNPSTGTPPPLGPGITSRLTLPPTDESEIDAK
ncbi:MAG: hypothetical protein L7W43_11800 [Rubripirellula sp.]|nr:hypothetical protein [Rhodopirellula sp.]MCH1440334.1 hypothetical protein [Rubripirellula sp.]OUX06285.1 MAG: hypothetical protein CBE00_08050 [Planctomycetaceae bacterium TMED240]